MGQLLAASISREDLLAPAIRHELEALGRTTVPNADGWGVGFYQTGEVLHRKRPQTNATEVAWADVVDELVSHVAIMHVRNATTGDGRADNTHPFRMRQWLFAHVGDVGGFDAIRGRLTESLPDFLRRNLRGDTDSEHVFHVFLSFLHDAGQLDAVDVAPSAVVGALRSTATLLERHAKQVGAPAGSTSLVVTNGRDLYAMRRGIPLVVVERDRLTQRSSDPEAGRPAPVRYVLVTSGDETPLPAGYRALAEGEIICVGRDLNVASHTS